MKNGNGDTPLHISCKKENYEMFLKLKANVKFKK